MPTAKITPTISKAWHFITTSGGVCEIQHPEVQAIIRLRETCEAACREYTPRKDAYVTATVERYLAQKDSFPPLKFFRQWLRWTIMDERLEDEIWQEVVRHLTPDDFQGWYMLIKNGEHQEPFEATDNRAAGRYVGRIRRYAKDKTITYTYVPLADVIVLAAA
jgi:hypothetical protein